jgi:hypothetical protein
MGACVEATAARQLCGGAGPTAGGTCEGSVCRAGEIMVLGGGCASAPATNPCRADEHLYRGNQGRWVCVDQTMCGAGLAWNGKACAARPNCAAGTLAHNGTCAPFLDGAGNVDLGAWTNAAIGLDGGTASDELCRGLVNGALTSTFPGLRVTVWLNVAIDAIEQDSSRAQINVKATPASLQASAQSSGSTIISGLREVGRPSNAARATRRVSCTLPSFRWVAEPESETSR